MEDRGVEARNGRRTWRETPWLMSIEVSGRSACARPYLPTAHAFNLRRRFTHSGANPADPNDGCLTREGGWDREGAYAWAASAKRSSESSDVASHCHVCPHTTRTPISPHDPYAHTEAHETHAPTHNRQTHDSFSLACCSPHPYPRVRARVGARVGADRGASISHGAPRGGFTARPHAPLQRVAGRASETHAA